MRNLCKSNLFPSVIAIIVEQNYKDTCERLKLSVASGMKLNASVETVAAMCTGGVTACIYGLVSDYSDVDPEYLAEQVGAIVSSIVKE